VDDRGVDSSGVDVAVVLDVDHECAHVQVLVEIQLVLHVLHLREHLVRQQPQPSQILTTLTRFYLERKEVVLLEDKSGVRLWGQDFDERGGHVLEGVADVVDERGDVVGGGGAPGSGETEDLQD